MNLELAGRRRFAGPIAAAFVLIGLAALSQGCAKRINTVDSTFSQVEGVPSTSLLVVYPDTPSLTYLFDDELPPGPNPPANPPDPLLEVQPVYLQGPGVVHGMIFDNTPAGAFQVYRREDNGGYLRLGDFELRETKQWIESQSELFAFSDSRPTATPTYVGRGIVGDVVTPDSPLTNVAQTAFTPVDTVHYSGDTTPTDSLFTLAWSPVAGAAGYWLHVYQFRADLQTFGERVASGVPSPIFGKKALDFLVAFVPAGATSYRFGDAGLPGTRVLFSRTPAYGNFYFARVSAVDAAGRMIATTSTSGDYVTQLFVDQTYLVYPLGAKTVFPSRLREAPTSPSGTPEAAAVHTVDIFGPGSRIVSREALPLSRR
jgi:hypothetical protein